MAQNEASTMFPSLPSPPSQSGEYWLPPQPLLFHPLPEIIGQAAERVDFVEKLIWNCTNELYRIYGSAIPNSYPPDFDMSSLVHEAITKALCYPYSAQTFLTFARRHGRSELSLPLFIAEVLRSTYSTPFICCTAIRYILDLEPQIRSSITRMRCGWCRSGLYCSEHAAPRERSIASRYHKRKPSTEYLAHRGQMKTLPASHFIQNDRFALLSNPRLTFAGAIVAALKHHFDNPMLNSVYAQQMRLPKLDLNTAERAVEEALGWSLNRRIVKEEVEGKGSWLVSSLHCSYGETTFPVTQSAVLWYGVKEMREKQLVPSPIILDTPPINNNSTSGATASASNGLGVSLQASARRRYSQSSFSGEGQTGSASKKRKLTQ